jgi:hypothetical protein
MSRKIIPATVVAVLFASTGLASAQAPSAEGFGSGPYQSPAVQSVTPAPYAQFNGYYNMAPTDRYLYGSAPRRHAAPENGAVR